MSRREANWNNNVLNVQAFFNNYGRWPSRMATEADEKRIGTWLMNMRREAKNGSAALTTERKAILDDAIPSWNAPKDSAWTLALEELVEFIELHGQYPVLTGDRDDELRLARWLRYNRYKKLDDEDLKASRIAALDQAAPFWRTGQNIKVSQKWATKADSLRDFIGAYRRLPEADASQMGEKKIGTWLKNQVERSVETSPAALNSGQIEVLNSITPLWDSGVKGQSNFVWLTHLHQVKAFHTAQGKWPVAAQHPDVNSGAECRLGLWLAQQRVGKNLARTGKGMPASQIAYLDRHLPGWFSGNLAA